MHLHYCRLSFFFFNDTATTEIYTLSLHDALPILYAAALMTGMTQEAYVQMMLDGGRSPDSNRSAKERSEEHTSELQSLAYLVCRLLLEKKKKNQVRRRKTCVDMDKDMVEHRVDQI